MIILPARSYGNKRIRTNIIYSQECASNFKIDVRNIAKTFPEYHIPINIYPEVNGKSDDGDIIQINTLGRWIFGTPGYMGNVIFDAFEQPAVIIVPECIPIEGIQLLEKSMY